jgi:hypothetical protein
MTMQETAVKSSRSREISYALKLMMMLLLMILTVVTTTMNVRKGIIVLDVTPCSPIEVYSLVEGNYFFPSLEAK